MAKGVDIEMTPLDEAGLVGDNLLDVDVRNSVQFHKDEILLPGRSIKFFMTAKFGAEPPADKAPTGYYKRATGYGSDPFWAEHADEFARTDGDRDLG